MLRLTTGQAIVRYLAAQSSERDGHRQRLVPAMLGIFGHGNVAGLGEALAGAEHLLPFVQGRNEQSLVHIASAFARERRRLSTLAVTSSIGPGSTNLVTGAALATVNRVPVLLLPSDVFAGRQQGNVLQQLEHTISRDVSVNDSLRPVSRFFDRILRPEQLLDSLPEAMRMLTSPRDAGAVTIALPQDVQSEAGRFPESFFSPHTWQVERPVAREDDITRLAERLWRAERPLVVAGGGVFYSAAEAELEELSSLLGAPVAETFAGKGSMTAPSWRVLGGIGVEGTPATNAVAAEADLVLCVGTRLGDFITGSRSLFKRPGAAFCSINIDGRDAAKLGATALVCDAREGLAALADACRRLGAAPRAEYERSVSELQASWAEVRGRALVPRPGEQMRAGEIIAVLNDAALPGDVIVTAAGAPPGDLLKIWDATGGRRCHIEFGFSCMGYEVPGGVGASLALPEAHVVVLVGDGSFLIAPGELATALQERLPVTVVVLDNHGYQVIRRLQVERGGRSFGNEFRLRRGRLALSVAGGGDVVDATPLLDGEVLPLDLVAIASGLGAEAVRVESLDALREALTAARQTSGPFVIVAEIDPYADLPPSGAWWDVAPAEVSHDLDVKLSRREYEDARSANQHFYGHG